MVEFKVYNIFFTNIIYYLDIPSINIKTTFLYQLINQLIYIKILKTNKMGMRYNLFCKLYKTLYRLKLLYKL